MGEKVEVTYTVSRLPRPFNQFYHPEYEQRHMESSLVFFPGASIFMPAIPGSASCSPPA